MTQFLSYTSLHLGDRELAMIPQFFSAGGDFEDLIPVYEKMGKKLIMMHSFEKNLTELNKYSYFMIPQI